MTEMSGSKKTWNGETGRGGRARTAPAALRSGLAATFSPELADLTIYVIDVAEGEKIPRKGGPGITRSDLLVINKIDLAPLVGANLGVMEADTLRMRANRSFVFTNFKSGEGVDHIDKCVSR